MQDKSSGRGYVGVIALIALCQFLFAIDFHSVNIAMVAIGGAFGLSPALLAWIMSAYFLTYAGLLILGGKIGDLYGRRLPCVLGVAAFGLGSLGAFFAPSFTVLLAARGVEGLGSALMIPTSFSLINVLLPPGPLRHRAFAVYSATQGVAMLLGQNLGGLVTTYFGWRSVFLLSLPAAIAALVLALKFAPGRQSGEASSRLDWMGAALVTGAIASLLLGISAASQHGLLSSGAAVGCGGAVVLFAAFALLESRLKEPLLPASIFAHPDLAGAALACVAMAATVGSAMVLLNLYMQEVMHLTAIMAGFRMLPFALAMIATGRVLEGAMRRFSLRSTVLASGAVAVIGSAMLSFAALPQETAYLSRIVPAMIVFCIGSTSANVALMALGTAAAPSHRQGLATGVLITCLQIGMGLGVSVCLAVLNAALDAHLPPTQSFAVSFLTAGASAALGIVCVAQFTRKSRPASTALAVSSSVEH
jgi:DHA2 family methylenomycin A resistance protein-like MFS transporter